MSARAKSAVPRNAMNLRPTSSPIAPPRLTQQQQQQDELKPQRKIVGHYMLGKSIGQGTFGKVMLGIHLPTGEKVGEKILCNVLIFHFIALFP